MESQILSNFKLFSKSSTSTPNANSPLISLFGNTEISRIIQIENYHNLGYYIFAIILIGISAVVYYQQDYIKFALNSWVGKLWLKTHLTSDGELSSTYVPASKYKIF